MAITRDQALKAVEIVSLVAAVGFGTLWVIFPQDNYEPPFGLCTLVFVATELFRRYGPKQAADVPRFTPDELVRHREDMRQRFQAEIYECRARELRKDVIVHDVDRVDEYPEIDENTPGISSWFRVALLDTYHRGIVLGIDGVSLIDSPEGPRRANSANGEEGTYCLLMGDVPYDSIVSVNMDGDDYYNFPHIYCHFDFNGEPYERLWYCQEEMQPHGHPYFREIASYQEVKDNTDAARAGA